MSLDKNNTKIVDHLFRKQYGKMVSILTSLFGFHNMDLAEDIVQETLFEACNRWAYDKIPRNPEAWLMLVAKNKALNYIKREKNKLKSYDRLSLTVQDDDVEEHFLENEIQDKMLRMIFACCHPSISNEDQISLVLKSLCGFSVKEIATALLSNEEAIAKRIYRAKKWIVEKNIKLEVPASEELKERINIVCVTLYLLFNEGYNSQHSDRLIRKDLCFEAMYLCKILIQQFPNLSKIKTLFALMCFHSARFESRQDDNGAIIILKEQDRGMWNQELIQAGLYYLTEIDTESELSSYHLEASIAAQHCIADSMESTDWASVEKLYQKLYDLKPNPIIQLNLAIITGMKGDYSRAIIELKELANNRFLQKYYLYYASLGEFYRLKKEKTEAKKFYQKALSLTKSEAEKDFLKRKIQSL